MRGRDIIDMTAAPAEFLQYVDAHKDAFVKRLADAIAIPRSVHPSSRTKMSKLI